MPTQPTPTPLSSYANAPPTLDRASVAAADLDGALWTDTAKRPTGGWALGADSFPQSAGIGGVQLQNESRIWDFGGFIIDPPGNGDTLFRVAIRVSHQGSRWKYLARINLGFVEIAAPTGSGEDWYVSDPIPFPNAQPTEVRIYATVADSGETTAGDIMKSVCILAETDDAAPDWQPCSPRNVVADSPDDADFIRLASDQHQHVVERYPRILATHSFGDASSSEIGAGIPWDSEHHYLVQAGPLTSAFRVYVYAEVTSDPPEEFANVDVDLDGVTVLSQSLAAGAFAWHDLGTFAITEDGRVPLLIRGRSTDSVGAESQITIRHICIVEEPHDPLLVVSTFDGRNDPVPRTLQRPDVSRVVPDSPIVASSYQLPGSIDRTDRVTALQSRAYEAIYRTHNVVTDHLLDSGESYPATSGAYPQTLTRWKWRRTRSGKSLTVRAVLYRTGTPSATAPRMRVQLKEGDSIEGGTTVPAERGYVEIAFKLGAFRLTDADTIDCEIQAGFVDAAGNAVSGGTDEVRLVSLQWREEPLPVRGAYFYQVDTPGTVIAAGGSGSYAITVPAASDFEVKHVRAKVVVSGADASGVTIGIESPTPTGVFVKESADPFPNGWLSDDEIDDTFDGSLPFPMSTIAGGDAAGDWSLIITNSSTADVTIEEFGIELR